MKRFEVLYGDGKCSIREMPGEFRCDPDGLEVRLVSAVKNYFGCEANQVGIPASLCRTWSADGDFELLKKLFPGKVQVGW